MTKNQKRILDLNIMIAEKNKIINNYRSGSYLLNKELQQLVKKEAAKKCLK